VKATLAPVLVARPRVPFDPISGTTVAARLEARKP